MKKITITLTLCLAIVGGLQAQNDSWRAVHQAMGSPKNISFDASEVAYWVGSGDQSALLTIAWDNEATPTAYAWGVRWSGNITALGLLDTLKAYDTRINYYFSGSLLQWISYDDAAANEHHQGAAGLGFCYFLNGDWGNYTYDNCPIMDGDEVEISSTCMFTMTTAVAATNPNAPAPFVPSTTTIDSASILYWVGSGNQYAILAVNWPDTALAWGVRFNGGATTIKAVMDSIAAADPRFYFNGVNYIDAIHFVSGNDTIGVESDDTWMTSTNGVMNGGVSSMLVNGDLVRWFDWSSSPNPIYPVDTPSATPDEPSAEDATISSTDILYWVGSGDHSAILAVNWADTALAWGYRFSGDSVSLQSAMDDIATADPRFSYAGAGFVSDIHFVAGADTLGITPGNYWSSLTNGVVNGGLTSSLHDGDLAKWGDPASGTIVDSTYYEGWGWIYSYVWTMPIHPVSVPEAPRPEDATISSSDILYWVGSGNHSAILAVNWADTALAWGYRFSGDSVSLQSVMDDIATADPRFSYVGAGFVSDIHFVAGADTLGITPGNYWSSLTNGVVNGGLTSSLHDGDLAKWGDPASGTIVDSTYYEGWGWIYSYVWTMPIHPVSPIDTTPVQGPFCGAVGTEGCEAIAANSNRFVAWATGCTVERGYWDIAEAGNRVTYGNDTMAVGPVDINDNLNVVSLGDGGVATLTFSKPIKNGAGFDFAVFENSFDDHFLELAFVEVSSDGVRFVRFPATSLSPTTSQIGACGPVDPTFINNLAGKYRKGYGTPFNLDDIADSVGIDLNHITHVRVVDVVGTINPQYATYDAFGHIVNDPYPTNGYSGGFDLAGVGIINQDMEGIEGMGGGLLLTVYPNPATDRITVSGAEGTVLLYDMTGRLVKQQETDGTAVIGLQGIPRGVYILKVGESTCKIVVK